MRVRFGPACSTRAPSPPPRPRCSCAAAARRRCLRRPRCPGVRVDEGVDELERRRHGEGVALLLHGAVGHRRADRGDQVRDAVLDARRVGDVEHVREGHRPADGRAHDAVVAELHAHDRVDQVDLEAEVEDEDRQPREEGPASSTPSTTRAPSKVEVGSSKSRSKLWKGSMSLSVPTSGFSVTTAMRKLEVDVVVVLSAVEPVELQHDEQVALVHGVLDQVLQRLAARRLDQRQEHAELVVDALGAVGVREVRLTAALGVGLARVAAVEVEALGHAAALADKEEAAGDQRRHARRGRVDDDATANRARRASPDPSPEPSTMSPPRPARSLWGAPASGVASSEPWVSPHAARGVRRPERSGVRGAHGYSSIEESALGV